MGFAQLDYSADATPAVRLSPAVAMAADVSERPLELPVHQHNVYRRVITSQRDVSCR